GAGQDRRPGLADVVPAEGPDHGQPDALAEQDALRPPDLGLAGYPLGELLGGLDERVGRPATRVLRRAGTLPAGLLEQGGVPKEHGPAAVRRQAVQRVPHAVLVEDAGIDVLDLGP